MRTEPLILSLLLLMSLGCNASREEADLILTNGVIYTLDASFSVAEAIAIRDHRILAVGTTREISRRFSSGQVTDLEGAFVYPGWIDAHCHFVGYGMNLEQADLTGTRSVEEIISVLKAHRNALPGTWITGRGWDQNDWEVQEFPDRWMLDQHFPDVPVMLRRIDGHAAWVNSVALEQAGITARTRVEGGAVLLSEGVPSGILVDNAIGLVGSVIPPAGMDATIRALKQAEKNCFSVGLTSVQDAGLARDVVLLIDSLQQSGALRIRINAWLDPSEENIAHFVKRGPSRSDHLSVNTIKLFADGALGSRGARMIEPYSDDPGNRGLWLTPLETLEKQCRIAWENDFVVATHCIGDAANREILKMYAAVLGGKNDRRWRIEHAQVVHPDDFHYFGDYNIIPSVQPTHATSDMYWAEQRVGPERMKGAYAFKSLLGQNGWIPTGSDFPVEQINPLYGFYAAVARRDQSGQPAGGFQAEEAMSREDALRAMTTWAAKSAFEEDLKGSLEEGKLADLVVTTSDLMTADEEELFRIRVTATYLGGELVFRGDHHP